MVVKIQVEVFWVVTLSWRWRQQGLQNIAILQHYMASQSRRP